MWSNWMLQKTTNVLWHKNSLCIIISKQVKKLYEKINMAALKVTNPTWTERTIGTSYVLKQCGTTLGISLFYGFV